MDWRFVTGLLCLYGFLKELRPSEPFLTEYLINPEWYPNITLEQAYNDVYPVWTYSYLCLLVVVFLVTDLARYKVVIVVEGFAYVATWCLLIWGRGVGWMRAMQVKIVNLKSFFELSITLKLDLFQHRDYFIQLIPVQVAYGLATSTEVAYYTYIYAKVDPRHFQKITSFTRTAILLGRFLSGTLAQA